MILVQCVKCKKVEDTFDSIEEAGVYSWIKKGNKWICVMCNKAKMEI